MESLSWEVFKKNNHLSEMGLVILSPALSEGDWIRRHLEVPSSSTLLWLWYRTLQCISSAWDTVNPSHLSSVPYTGFLYNMESK